MNGKEKITVKTRILNSFRKLLMHVLLERKLKNLVSSQGILSRFAAKLVPPNYLYPKGSFRECTVRDIRLKLDISDYVGHYLYFGFPDEGYDKLFAMVKQGDVVLDIGANIGFTALRMAYLTGKDGKVFAFEPDPFNFSVLTVHQQMNPGLRVFPIHMGLGDQRGMLKLSVYKEGNRGMNRIDMNADHNFSLIEADTLDQVMQEHHLDRIDLMKIDVEGYEMKVLLGAKGTLAKFHPRLYLEVDDTNLRQQGSSAAMLLEFLSGLGYTCRDSVSRIMVKESALINSHFDMICSKE